MRLERVDAIRFGALEGASLTGIGERLTVVLGPNESGKSTFTALVRAVLFGFGTGKAKAGDKQYRCAAGERAGRLVYTDEAGEWAVERTGEKKGGAIAVTALRGAERPGLLDELVGEISEQTYRVVFGFGVDELDDIEHGDDKYLASRLFAAGTGLEVSALDVREQIAGEASALFGERARVAVVNDLLSRTREARETVRALEAQATAYAGEQAKAAALAAELEPLRAARDDAEATARALERDAERAARLAGDIESADAALGKLREDSAVRRGEVAACAVNDAVGAVAPELGAVLGDESAFRERIERARRAEAAAAEKRLEIDRLGVLPGGVTASAEDRARIDAWVSRKAALESDARASARAAEQSAGRAEGLSRAAGAPAGSSRRTAHLRVGATLAALGLLAALAGLLTRQWIAAGVGVLVAAIGAALLIARTPGAADLSAEAARLRADAEADRAVAAGDAARLAEEAAAWRSWLAEAGLDAFGDEPAAVRELLARLAAREEREAEAARLESEARRDRDLAAEWAQRLIALARGFLEIPASAGVEDAAGIAARARAALEDDREARARRDRAGEALRSLDAQEAGVAELLEGLRGALAALAEERGVEPADAHRNLAAAAADAAERLAEVRSRYEWLAGELNTLRGKLDNEGRDAAMAVARQKVEGLGARTAEEARRHVTAMLAVRLLDRARERFERERQPEVARVAGRVFREMTSGRYTDVRVPLDGSGVAVVTETGAVVPSSVLSRGTAEQLYLALRVAFLSSLPAGRSLPVLMDDVMVSADGERRQGVAAAIAELAASRQVVFFTCHEETAEVLSSAVPSRTLIRLDRCALRG